MQENSLTWGRGWAAFNVMIQYAQIRGQLSPYSCCELGGATPVRWASLPTGPSFTLPEEESIPCFQTLLSCFLALKSYQVCSVRATCHRLPLYAVTTQWTVFSSSSWMNHLPTPSLCVPLSQHLPQPGRKRPPLTPQVDVTLPSPEPFDPFLGHNVVCASWSRPPL